MGIFEMQNQRVFKWIVLVVIIFSIVAVVILTFPVQAQTISRTILFEDNTYLFDVDVNIGGITNGKYFKSEIGFSVIDETSDPLFDIFVAKAPNTVTVSTIPASTDNALVIQRSGPQNLNFIDVVFWDTDTNRPLFVLNAGDPGRASTFDRSLQVGKDFASDILNLDYTVCTGTSLADCDTLATGADLVVEDDIENFGSLKVHENAIIDGNITFFEFIFGNGSELTGLNVTTQDEDINVTTNTKILNFEGSGVTVVLDGPENKVTVTIPGVEITNQELFSAFLASEFDMTTTFMDLTNWDQNISDAPYDFNSTSGVLTFTEDSRYLVVVDAQVSDAGGRTTLFVQVLEDFGSGFTSTTRLQWRNYATRNATHKEGGITGTYIKDYNSGDSIKIQVKNVDTNPDIAVDDARFYVLKLKGVSGIDGLDGNDGAVGATGAGSTIIVQHNDINVGTVTSVLNFDGINFTVVDDGNNKTSVSVTSGVTVFGSEFEVFESLSESSTSSGSQQDKINVTTATKPVGLYRIGFSAEVTNSSGGNTINVVFSVDGVPIHDHDNGSDSLTVTEKNDNDWLTVSEVFYLDVVSSTTIDLDMTFSAGNNNARISNAVIEIWRVS